MALGLRPGWWVQTQSCQPCCGATGGQLVVQLWSLLADPLSLPPQTLSLEQKPERVGVHGGMGRIVRRGVEGKSTFAHEMHINESAMAMGLCGPTSGCAVEGVAELMDQHVGVTSHVGWVGLHGGQTRCTGDERYPTRLLDMRIGGGSGDPVPQLQSPPPGGCWAHCGVAKRWSKPNGVVRHRRTTIRNCHRPRGLRLSLGEGVDLPTSVRNRPV